MPGYKTVEDAFDCKRYRVEAFGLLSGFQSRYELKNKVKNLFCHFSLILFSLTRTCMKTCRLSASRFVPPLQFLSSTEAFCELLAYFAIKVASLMLTKFILRT